MPGLRILSIPGRNHENRFFRLLLDSLETSGAQVTRPTWSDLGKFNFDILCINFPTHHITEKGPIKAATLSIVFGAYLILTRLLRRKLVYIVHDVEPVKIRNQFLLGRFLLFVHALTDGYVFISKSSRRTFTRAFPCEEIKPYVVFPHGPYPTTPLTAEARAELRRSLVGENDVFLLGFLGNIKPYKNAAVLEAVPATLANGRAVRTLVAGRVEAGYEEEAQAVFDSLAADRTIRLDKALADAELDALIQAVDVVLMPYRRGSNSGLALLVLSNRGRLIGSSLPIFEELAADVGPPWVVIAESAGALPSVIEQAATTMVRDHDHQHLLAYLDQVSFETGARTVHTFCQRLTRQRIGVAIAQ